MDQQDPRRGPRLIDIEAILAKRRARAIEEDRARTIDQVRKAFALAEHREMQPDDL